MKKLFFLLSLFISQLVFSAPSPHIMLLPNKGQGYLVLDKLSLEDIYYWKTTIIQRTFVDQGNYSDDIVLETQLEPGINYQKIPQQYLARLENTKFLISVDGFDQGDQIITTENLQEVSNGPIDEDLEICTNCAQVEYGCSWTCIGPDYAWKIQQLTDGETFSYWLQPATVYNPVSEITFSYYEYMSESSYENSCPEPCRYTGIEHIGPLTNTGGYKDRYGNVISGDVYGISKLPGDWNGNINSGIVYDDLCAEDREVIIDLINNNSNPNPTLACEQEMDPVEPWGSQNPDTDPIINCHSLLSFSPKWYQCLYYGINTTSLTGLIIADLNNMATIDPIVVREVDLFAQDGSWNISDITMDPGLYSLGLAFEDGGYIPVIHEVTTTVNIDFQDADLLDVIVSPVPIVSNSFDLTLAAKAKLNFTYKLMTLDGEQLYSESYEMEKDEELTDVITPLNGIPTGFLVQRFEFSDGSVLTVQSMKN